MKNIDQHSVTIHVHRAYGYGIVTGGNLGHCTCTRRIRGPVTRTRVILYVRNNTVCRARGRWTREGCCGEHVWTQGGGCWQSLEGPGGSQS